MRKTYWGHLKATCLFVVVNPPIKEIFKGWVGGIKDLFLAWWIITKAVSTGILLLVILLTFPFSFPIIAYYEWEKDKNKVEPKNPWEPNEK